MKKIVCLLLALLVLVLAACSPNENTPTTEPTEKKEEKVTIYVPEKMTVTADGEAITVEMIPEDGWLDKDSFTLQVRSEDPKDSLGYNATYGEKIMILDYGEGAQEIEIRYDDAGQMTSQTVIFPENASIIKNETIMTYDSCGRTLRQETRIYYPNQDEPVTQTVEFTYTETETGSKGVASNGMVEQEMIYDANGRLICTATRTNGTEVTRTENTYDENGNQILSVTYVAGVETNKTETVYKAYEVTPEKAQKLSYFKQGKQ